MTKALQVPGYVHYFRVATAAVDIWDRLSLPPQLRNRTQKGLAAGSQLPFYTLIQFTTPFLGNGATQCRIAGPGKREIVERNLLLPQILSRFFPHHSTVQNSEPSSLKTDWCLEKVARNSD